MRADELIHEIPKGLLGWYDFQPGKTALYTGQSSDGLAGPPGGLLSHWGAGRVGAV